MRLPIRSVVCWTGGEKGIKKRSRPDVPTTKDECEKLSPRKRNQKYQSSGEKTEQKQNRKANETITDTNGRERESEGQIETVCSL